MQVFVKSRRSNFLCIRLLQPIPRRISMTYPVLMHVTVEQHKNEEFFHLLFVALSTQQAEKR